MSILVSIRKTAVTGSEIAPLVHRLERAMANEDLDHVLVALLAMAVVIVYPEIETEQLQKAVGNVSNYLCLTLGPDAMDPTGAVVMN